MTFLAAARDLLQDVIFLLTSLNLDDHQRPPNTSKHTDDVQRRDLHRNPRLSASELKDLLGNFSIRCIDHRPKKDLEIPSRCASFKTILSLRMRKKRPQFALRYLHGSVGDKKKFMWLDESTFQCIYINDYRTFWAIIDT